MSSTIDLILTKMEEAITGALPTYQKLSNPYTVSDNPDTFLREGYGITIGSAQQSRITQGSVGVQRTLSFILTKEVFATESDDATRTSTWLELINEQLAVLKLFEADFTLGGSVLKIEYNSDEGIQFVQNKSDKFLELKTNVSVLYIESVN